MSARLLPIELRQLSLCVADKTLLDTLDLVVPAEGISIVLGANGAGKSLLLRLLAGLMPPSRGHIVAGGVSCRDLSAPSEVRSMVFQTPTLLRLSVRDNVGFALAGAMASAKTRRRQRIDEMLERVGLAHRADEAAQHLSGGERQRLALARAWSIAPRLLLLDEPTANLDPTAVIAIEQIIRHIRSEGCKVVMSTHNLAQAARLADDIIFMAAGRLVEHSPCRRFFALPQSAAAAAFIKGELPWTLTR